MKKLQLIITFFLFASFISTAVEAQNHTMNGGSVPVAVFVPNVFSPNGDGKNDVFSIICTGISELDVSIYDLKGNLVYQWHELCGSWDGNANGKSVGQDTYVYLIHATGDGIAEINKRGTVTVLR